jgi:hypothetical protein
MTREGLEDKYSDKLSHACLIEHNDYLDNTQRGIMVLLGEPLSDKWRSGNWIVFWSNGDHTIPPDEFDIILDDLFDTGDNS